MIDSIPDESACGWCGKPHAHCRDEQRDPICFDCVRRPGPVMENATDASARLGVSVFLLSRAAKEEGERIVGTKLPEHVWTRLSRLAHKRTPGPKPLSFERYLYAPTRAQ